MNKLFWSAFAMSLCLLGNQAFSQTENIDDFLGMETDILPALDGPQKFTPKEMHQKTEWNVQEKEVEVDAEQPLKGQTYSLTPWDTQDPQEFLSIDKWLIERELKDKAPNWKLRLRDDRQNEHVGKVLQCRGKCEIYRGVMKAKVEHLSRIDEGDEFRTDADTIAWIYLMDGTLARIGPSSAVSFQEINWSKKEVFHLVRIHQGHIFWHPRSSKEFPLELGPETDAISLPLMVREANQAFYERDLFKLQSDFQRSAEVMKLEESAITAQVKKLNEVRTQNNQTLPPVTRVMMVAPNLTLVGSLVSFDLFHYPGGKSFFKKRLPQEEHNLMAQMRGYSSTENQPVTDEAWFEVDTTGRSLTKVEQVSGALEITELLTRRIKSFELAREIWMSKYTLDVVKTMADPKQMAILHGYSLWDESLDKRYEFLVEYTRRMETTNLRSMDNLLKKLETSGEVVQKEMSDSHYKVALNFYLRDLKTRYTDKKMQVREMNDLQYYVWILRDGKNQI